MTTLVRIQPTFSLMNVVYDTLHWIKQYPDAVLTDVVMYLKDIPQLEVHYCLQRRDALVFHDDERHYHLRLARFALIVHAGDTETWQPVAWYGFNPWLVHRRPLQIVA